MRKLGLDVGDKTVGVAVSDENAIISNGITTIKRIGIRKDTGKIIDLVKEYNADTVVIGLPIGLDGNDTIQTEKVREFKTMLENKLRSGGFKVKIEWQDERFSTVAAEKVLIEAGMRRENRKNVIDKQAAVIILQSFLDRINNEQ